MLRSLLKRAAEIVLSSGPAAWMARSATGPRDLILGYHNVVPDGFAGRGDVPLHIEQSRFAAQLDCLVQVADPVPLDRVLEPRPEASTGRWARPRVAITFDDAYRGAVTLAVRELTARGLPATIFVTPGRLGDHSFWWDELPQGGGTESALRTHALDELGGDESKIRLWAEERGIGLQPAPEPLRTATVEELDRAMQSPGITAGAHTWTHPSMPALGAAELAAELSRPREWLAERYPSYVDWLAYPYGHWSDPVAAAAERAGYRAAVRVDGAWLPRPAVDRFRLPRLSVPAGLSIEGFRARVSGAWPSA